MSTPRKKRKKKPSLRDDVRLLGFHDAEQQYGIKFWTLRDLVARGVLPVVALSGVRRLFIDRIDLEKLIEKSKQTELPEGEWWRDEG